MKRAPQLTYANVVPAAQMTRRPLVLVVATVAMAAGALAPGPAAAAITIGSDLTEAAQIQAKVLLVGGVGTGPTVDLPGAGTFQFPTNLPIRAGDWLGLDSSGSTAFGACQGGAETWRLSPPVAEGSYLPPAQSNEGCELLVDAVVEPSASVAFGGGRVTRAGRTLLALRPPGPGKLTLQGREIRTVTREVAEAGDADVIVHLRPEARRRLAASGHLRLTIDETFAPNGGAPASETKTVNLKEGKR